MKRFLSLFLVVVMLFAVLAMVSCKDSEDTTAGTTTPANTTPDTTTTEPPVVTTPDDTTTDTTKPTEPTTTTEPPKPTETTTTDTTKPTEPTGTTTITEGTTLPVFARFDFGTKTKAEAQGLTSHEYIKSALTYNSDYLYVEFTEDTVILYAVKDYASGADFAMRFDDLVTYDFDDSLKPGWGSWNNFPYNTNSVGITWVGRHQYMQIRILNASSNNIIGFQFGRTGSPAYYTTQVASNMYLQGGAPTAKNDYAMTTTPSNEWKTYTYDCFVICSLASGKVHNSSTTDYYTQVSDIKTRGSVPGNAWHYASSEEVVAIRFHLLGALANYNANITKTSDTRQNIKAGDHVEVDYIIFGSSKDQLDAWTSYLEDKANA